MAFPLWLILAALIILAFVIIFKSVNQVYILSLIKKHFFWIFFIAIIVFVAISLTHIHAAYDLDFSTWEGFVAAGKIYFAWLKTVFINLGKVTGYAVQQDWFTPANSTG